MRSVKSINFAQALFDLCVEDDCLDKAFDELKMLNGVLAENPDFVSFLKLPTVDANEKAEVLESVFKDKISRLMLDFLCVLVKENGVGAINGIVSDFTALYNDKMNILEACAVTAVPLNDNLRMRLKDKLHEISGKNIVLHETIDPKIIGGIVLKLDDATLSGSVKSRLDGLKAQLDAATL